MTELYPTDAELNALSGTVDPEQEVLFIPTGESPYHTSFYKMLHRLLDVARRAGDLRVYKDGELTFGVRAGRFLDGATPVEFPGAGEQPLTDNATQAIYLLADGTLAVATDGFPDPAAVPNIPLATIDCADGGYDHADITDCRGRAMLSAASGMAAADANALTGGGIAGGLHTHAAEGIEDGAVTAAKLAAAASQEITASNQTIQHDGRRLVSLTTPDGATKVLGTTAAAVADGTVDGQLLTLRCAGGEGSLRIADNPPTANVDLGGDWYPYETDIDVSLTLMWDASAGLWRELFRSSAANDNSGLLAAASGGRDHSNTGGYAGSAGGRFNVNSHNYTGSAGGFHNVNSGQRAGSVGGQGNTNSGASSGSVGGVHAKCRHEAESLAASYGLEASPGDCQVTNFMLRGDYTADANEHTTPVWHELTSPERWTLEAETTVGFTVTVVGRKSDGSKAALFKRMALLERDDSNNTTIVGAAQTLGTDIADDANWDVQLSADDTNEALKIEVHAADNDGDVRWTAHVQAQVCG